MPEGAVLNAVKAGSATTGTTRAQASTAPFLTDQYGFAESVAAWGEGAAAAAQAAVNSKS